MMALAEAISGNLEPLVKWSGSKRPVAGTIARLFGPIGGRYHEPFLGGGAVLGAATFNAATAGDIQSELVALWIMTRDRPAKLADAYTRDWQLLQERGHKHFYAVRERFNQERQPEDLLFLSRTCVNGLIRFNKDGDFNNSLHHTRPGIHPERLRRAIMAWSTKIQRAEFFHGDFRGTLDHLREGDAVYVDPPYFNNFGRYANGVDFNDLMFFIDSAISHGAKIILSYDGRRGSDHYKQPSIPADLFPLVCEIPTGNSPFKKTQDKQVVAVYERLYCSWVPDMAKSLIHGDVHETVQTTLGDVPPELKVLAR